MFSLFQAVSWGHVCSPTCHRGAQSAVSGFPPPGGNSHSESETWGKRGKGGKGGKGGNSLPFKKSKPAVARPLLVPPPPPSHLPQI